MSNSTNTERSGPSEAISIVSIRTYVLEQLQLPYDYVCNLIFAPLSIAHICNTLYGLGFTVQISMLPYIVMELRAPITTNGYVLGFFALLQLIGAPIFGCITDRFGPRTGFQLSLCSAAIMYTLLAVSTASWQLYLAVLPACMSHGFMASAIIVCYSTTLENRTPAIAYLSVSYGAGMVIGGLIGVGLSSIASPRGLLLITAAAQMAGCALSLGFDLYDYLQKRREDRSPPTWGGVFTMEYNRMVHVLKKTQALCFLLFFGLLPVLMTRFSFAPIAINAFSMSPRHASYLVTYIGLVTLLTEGLIAPVMSKKFGDIISYRWSVVISAFGYLMLSLSADKEAVMLVLLSFPLLGGALLYVCATGLMTKSVEKPYFGTVLGINSSIFYFVSGVAPLIAIPVYAKHGLSSYWIASGIFSTLVAVYIYIIDPFSTKAYRTSEELQS